MFGAGVAFLMGVASFVSVLHFCWSLVHVQCMCYIFGIGVAFMMGVAISV